MDWAETRRGARAIVHETFGLDAHYFVAPGVGLGTPVSVRVHGVFADIGNLNREGYGQTTEEVERIVMLRTDVDQLGVKQGHCIVLDNDGRVYRLTVRKPENDVFTVEYEVTRVSS